MKKILLALFLLISGLVAKSFTYTDYGRVIDVKNEYIQIQEIIPVKECWNEQIDQVVRPQNDNVIGTIVGGTAGGVIGHQFGKGSGKTAATVGGAIVGSLIGNNLSDSDEEYIEVKTVKKCKTINRTEYREKNNGSKIKIDYKGKILTKKVYHPVFEGEKFPLKIEINY